MIQYGIYALLIVVSLISVCVVNVLSKEKDIVHKSFFFFFCYYFVMSVVKYKQEGPGLTLFQSFWEAVPKTYLNYGLPLIVIAVIVPVAAWFIFKKLLVVLIRWHVSIMLISGVLASLAFGKITNIQYIILYLFTVIIAFVIGAILKKEQEYLTLKDIITKDKKAGLFKKYLMVDMLPVFLVLFYFPNELYLTNISEFNNPYWSFLAILVISTILFSIILFTSICLLPKAWIDICQRLIFALSICAYFQYLFMNRSMKTLSGSEQIWSISEIFINLVIWILVISAVVFISRKIDKFISVMNYISIFLMLILLSTTITLIVQNISSLGKSTEALTTEGDLILASDSNVVVFVLDMFDTRLFEQVAENDGEFVSPLKDFTFYDNTVSRYIMTYFAVPYMLTGAEWQDNTGDRWYHEYAYDGETFLSDLYAEGIDLGVYTSAEFIGSNHLPMIRNYKAEVEKKSDIVATVSTMYKTSMYKVMPFAVKNSYSYYSSDIFYMVDSGEVWNTDNDIEFYKRIMANGISVDENIANAFRFYHMRGAHDPYYLSEDIQEDKTRTQATSTSQAKGVLKIVYAYIEQLKEKGLYDNTTIIITADHGVASWCDKESGKMVDVSMPLLLVKTAGQSGTEISYNHAPVEQGEMLSSIMDAYGLDYPQYGKRLSDVEESVNRSRAFGYARPGAGILKGTVTGEAHDLNNWVVDSFVEVDVEY